LPELVTSEGRLGAARASSLVFALWLLHSVHYLATALEQDVPLLHLPRLLVLF